MKECFQMHNVKGRFVHDGKICESEYIPGYIDYEKDNNLKEDEVVLICTANEREDFYDVKELKARTHYKSSPLYINGEEFFPSLIPERNDVKGYPLWFEKGNDSYNYNFYQLWENAVVNTGLIFPNNNKRKISFLDMDNKSISSTIINPTSKVQKIKLDKVNNIKITSKHLFAEVDNTVFQDGKEMNDKYIKQNSIFKLIIEDLEAKKMTVLTLPYPTVYVNSFYFININK
jgi:hypothetical protein